MTQKVKRLMVFQTLTIPGKEVFEDTGDHNINDRNDLTHFGWAKMAFIENKFAGDPTNWWFANHAGVEAMLRSSGLKIIGYPGHEIYLCEPDLKQLLNPLGGLTALREVNSSQNFSHR